MQPEAWLRSGGQKNGKTGWPEIGGVGGEAADARHDGRGVPGRQTDERPHGAQEMSGLNRNGCLLF
ncbi:hypothetical protein [Caballeronia temeraria]|uniref:hypothetical protein n=1 Tax=Caballeronia temeraria TaxID=1777137 RepID=UPI001428A125|nr:hypothetical protein [Caballeronia temeraria]